MSGSALHLEITETCLLRDLDTTITTLRAIKELGVRISIDDFGTGYSSFSVLRQLPIDTLKIDRSFVNEATLDRGGSMIASAIISLAGSLGLEIVAEEVEGNPTLEFVSLVKSGEYDLTLVNRACKTIKKDIIRRVYMSAPKSVMVI